MVHRHQSQTIFLIVELVKKCVLSLFCCEFLKRVPRFWVSVRWLVCGVGRGGPAGRCLGAAGT